MDEEASLQEFPKFRVTDLKQWVYCPRVFYYHVHLPDIRPTTYKMEAGKDAGRLEVKREKRRTLQAYGISQGRREFDVPVASSRFDLQGVADMVIWQEGNPPQVIPVDYKLSKKAGAHFKLQLMAYALLLEEMSGAIARRGFLYLIPLRKTQEVRFTSRLRSKTIEALENMRAILHSETMPSPTSQTSKCVACEFRRFCNDVL